MTLAEPNTRRRWRWLRWVIASGTVVVLLLAFGGWLRGRDQWGPFRGQVVDAETGAPIPNANVMVTWLIRRFNPVDSRSEFWDAQETVTDANGGFEIPRLWRLWTWNVMEPGIGYFAPGHVALSVEVTPPDGTRFVDPTVVKLQPQETQEERCRRQPGGVLHDKAPRFRAAVDQYRLSLVC